MIFVISAKSYVAIQSKSCPPSNHFLVNVQYGSDQISQ